MALQARNVGSNSGNRVELRVDRARHEAKAADKVGDGGTNDMVVSDILRSNDPQPWFLGQHLAEMPLVFARGETPAAGRPTVHLGRLRLGLLVGRLFRWLGAWLRRCRLVTGGPRFCAT